jgi:hypothetical protein
MAAEAATEVEPRMATRPATPLHVIMTGGMIAYYNITDEGMPLRTAAEAAGQVLVALGYVDSAPAASTIEKWTRRYAAREHMPMPKQGRPAKKPPTAPG